MGNEKSTSQSKESLDKLLEDMRRQFRNFNVKQANQLRKIIDNELLKIEKGETLSKVVLEEKIKNLDLKIYILDLARNDLKCLEKSDCEVSYSDLLKETDQNNGPISKSNSEDNIEVKETIKYYWVEYTIKENEEEVTRKISLFAKIFDKGSKNLHVLPGVIEKWELIKENSNSSKKDLYSACPKTIIRFNNKKNQYTYSTTQYLIEEIVDKNTKWLPSTAPKFYLTGEDNQKNDKAYLLIKEMSQIQVTLNSLLKEIHTIISKKGIASTHQKGYEGGFSSLYRGYGFCWIDFDLSYPQKNPLFTIKGGIFPYNIINIPNLGCFYKYGSFMLTFDANDEVMKDYYSAPNVNREDFTISFIDNNDNPLKIQLLYNSKKDSKKPYWFNYLALGKYLFSLFQTNQRTIGGSEKIK